MNGSFSGLLLVFHFVATLFMTGVIWFVQVVHYPLFALMEGPAFQAYERQNTALTTRVVAPAMLVEGATAVLLFWVCPAGISLWPKAAGLALLAVIWLSTALVQVPCHTVLSRGFDLGVHSQLMWTNWLRTSAWSVRSVLVAWIVWSSFR